MKSAKIVRNTLVTLTAIASYKLVKDGGKEVYGDLKAVGSGIKNFFTKDKEEKKDKKDKKAA